MNKKRYKLTLSYDGTAYCGWQTQPNGLTIQNRVQRAFEILCKKKIHVTGSGRTDAGVHALGQVAHVDLDQEIELKKLQYSLNAILPDDIRIKKIEPTILDFHARYSAFGKIYHYHLHLDDVIDPFIQKYRHVVKRRINLDLLEKSAKLFIGTHNFQSFANKQDHGSAKNDPIKTIYRLDMIKEANGVRLEFEGDGFLYKMIRNIVGTMLDINDQKIALSDVKKILEAKDRKQAGSAAPAKGLFLVKVLY